MMTRADILAELDRFQSRTAAPAAAPRAPQLRRRERLTADHFICIRPRDPAFNHGESRTVFLVSEDEDRFLAHPLEHRGDEPPLEYPKFAWVKVTEGACPPMMMRRRFAPIEEQALIAVAAETGDAGLTGRSKSMRLRKGASNDDVRAELERFRGMKEEEDGKRTRRRQELGLPPMAAAPPAPGPAPEFSVLVADRESRRELGQQERPRRETARREELMPVAEPSELNFTVSSFLDFSDEELEEIRTGGTLRGRRVEAVGLNARKLAEVILEERRLCRTPRVERPPTARDIPKPLKAALGAGAIAGGAVLLVGEGDPEVEAAIANEWEGITTEERQRALEAAGLSADLARQPTVNRSRWQALSEGIQRHLRPLLLARIQARGEHLSKSRIKWNPSAGECTAKFSDMTLTTRQRADRSWEWVVTDDFLSTTIASGSAEDHDQAMRLAEQAALEWESDPEHSRLEELETGEAEDSSVRTVAWSRESVRDFLKECEVAGGAVTFRTTFFGIRLATGEMLGICRVGRRRAPTVESVRFTGVPEELIKRIFLNKTLARALAKPTRTIVEDYLAGR